MSQEGVVGTSVNWDYIAGLFDGEGCVQLYPQKRNPRVRLILPTEEEEGGYSVRCVELPAAISQGETREDALANIKEAIGLVLEELESRMVCLPENCRKETVVV